MPVAVRGAGRVTRSGRNTSVTSITPAPRRNTERRALPEFSEELAQIMLPARRSRCASG